MKPFLSTLTLLLLLVGFARASDIESPGEFQSAIAAPKPIVLDGDLSEWSGVPAVVTPRFAVPKGTGSSASPNYVPFEEYDGGTWSGPDDQSATVQIAFDDDNVYLGIVVTDDYHENVSGTAWDGDAVQVLIADATRSQIVALYNYALNGYEDAQGKFVQTDGIIIEHVLGPATNETCHCATQAVIKRDSANKKTTYEIKLPKAALGLTSAQREPQFGLGIAINDGDGALVNGVQYGQSGQEGQKGWSGLGPHAVVFGRSPKEAALVTVRNANDIENSLEHVTAQPITKSIVLDGKLDEWPGTAIIANPKFAVPKNSAGKQTLNFVPFEPYDGGTWSGPEDQSSELQIAYDSNNVYLGLVVTDDYHENVSSTAWNGDAVQLMIANATRTDAVALYNYALGGYKDSDRARSLKRTGSWSSIIQVPRPTALADAPPTSASSATRPIRKRPMKSSSRPLRWVSQPRSPPDTKFGLGMAINDGDGALVDGVQYGQAGQEGQKGWSGLGAHAVVLGRTPTETAEVTLGDGKARIAVVRSGNTLSIQWAPASGVLEASPTLTHPAWSSVGSNNPATIPIGSGERVLPRAAVSSRSQVTKARAQSSAQRCHDRIGGRVQLGRQPTERQRSPGVRQQVWGESVQRFASEPDCPPMSSRR